MILTYPKHIRNLIPMTHHQITTRNLRRNRWPVFRLQLWQRSSCRRVSNHGSFGSFVSGTSWDDGQLRQQQTPEQTPGHQCGFKCRDQCSDQKWRWQSGAPNERDLCFADKFLAGAHWEHSQAASVSSSTSSQPSSCGGQGGSIGAQFISSDMEGIWYPWWGYESPR